MRSVYDDVELLDWLRQRHLARRQRVTTTDTANKIKPRSCQPRNECLS
jgi:hypothetical protein